MEKYLCKLAFIWISSLVNCATAALSLVRNLYFLCYTDDSVDGSLTCLDVFQPLTDPNDVNVSN